jgi:hypothetical protein
MSRVKIGTAGQDANVATIAGVAESPGTPLSLPTLATSSPNRKSG